MLVTMNSILVHLTQRSTMYARGGELMARRWRAASNKDKKVFEQVN
jgi:hypothetical protein